MEADKHNRLLWVHLSYKGRMPKSPLEVCSVVVEQLLEEDPRSLVRKQVLGRARLLNQIHQLVADFLEGRMPKQALVELRDREVYLVKLNYHSNLEVRWPSSDQDPSILELVLALFLVVVAQIQRQDSNKMLFRYLTQQHNNLSSQQQAVDYSEVEQALFNHLRNKVEDYLEEVQPQLQLLEVDCSELQPPATPEVVYLVDQH